MSEHETTIEVGQEWWPELGRKAKPRRVLVFCNTQQGYPGVRYSSDGKEAIVSVEGFQRWARNMNARAHHG